MKKPRRYFGIMTRRRAIDLVLEAQGRSPEHGIVISTSWEELKGYHGQQGKVQANVFLIPACTHITIMVPDGNGTYHATETRELRESIDFVKLCSKYELKEAKQ